MPEQNTSSPTPSGRAVSALNHLTHGGTSQTLFLKDEDPDEFFALLEDAFKYHSPTNSQDAGLVTDTVLARWFVLRRQKMCIDNEAELHSRKPQVTYWVEPDLKNIELLDRYKTQAERALTRALNNVRHIRKDALAESHWQTQHELQKERFALQRERFELAKEKEARLAARQAAKQDPPAATPQNEQEQENQMKSNNQAEAKYTEEMDKLIAEVTQEVKVDQFGAYILQAIYVSVEDGRTKVFDVSPTNDEVRRIMGNAAQYPTPPTKVIREYIFAGRVPPEYEWLITSSWQRKAKDFEIHLPLEFAQWKVMADREDADDDAYGNFPLRNQDA